MANPTTAKPTAVMNEWSSTASTVGELMRCCAVFSNTEPARDVVGNVLGIPMGNGSGSGAGGNSGGTGHPPAIVTGAFTFNSLSDPVARFGAGTTAVRFPGRGFTSVALNQTFWCVFKPLATACPNARTVAIWGQGADTFGRHIAISVSTAGVITLGRYYSTVFNTAGITLTSGKTYLVSMTSLTTTSNLVNVYCYDDQAYVTPSGTGTTFTTASVSSNSNKPDLLLNSLFGFDGYTIDSFIGDVYACGTSTATFDPATNTYFAALVADPCIAARGAYSGGSGTLTAGGITSWDITSTSVKIYSNRPTGGTYASYQYRLHRSLTVNFTPDTTTRIGSLQSSPIFQDTMLAPYTNYCYKVEQTDGTSTVYSTTAASNLPLAFGRLSAGDFFFGIISDSRWSSVGQAAALNFCANLKAAGYRCGFLNMGAGSTGVYNGSAAFSWQPNTTQDPTNGQASTTLLANALTRFAQAGNITHVLSLLGVNDAGANSTSVFLTKYGYIATRVAAAGFTMFISAPYQSQTSAAVSAAVQSYQQGLSVLDNGSTVRVLASNSYNLSMYGIETLSYDFLHELDPQLDGAAVLKGVLPIISILSVTFPMLTTAGGNYSGLANTITGTRVIDGGSSSAVTGTFTKLSDGSFKLTCSVADLAGVSIVFTFTATGCRTVTLSIVLP